MVEWNDWNSMMWLWWAEVLPDAQRQPEQP